MLEKFIKKCIAKYHNKYDYSKVEYVNKNTKVCIICPLHGEFWQTPSSHLNSKHGCIECGKINQLKKIRHNNNKIFKTKANIKHNNCFDYSKVEYVNAHTKICIICPIHGEFWQTPYAHLNGQGCPLCRYIICGDKLRKNVDLFLNEANLLYKNKYDYSKIKYINNKTSICIICKEHGEFSQTPSYHLSGHGCPKCSNIISNLEDIIKSFFTVKNIKFEIQQKFDWLKHKHSLSLDFYLPQYNVAIECQGMQHFGSNEFFGGEEAFKLIKERDQRKLELCNENGVKLLYFSNLGIDYPYEVFEDKELLLNEILNKHECKTN